MHAIIWILDSGTGEDGTGTGEAFATSANASPLRIVIGTRSGSLGSIIQNFKSISTRKINLALHSAEGLIQLRDPSTSEASDRLRHGPPKSLVADASTQHIWQRNYFEHIVRNQAELERISEYIAGNPQQWAEDEENPERSWQLRPLGHSGRWSINDPSPKSPLDINR